MKAGRRAGGGVAVWSQRWGLCLEKEKEQQENTHKKGKIETPSCYSSLTFSMSA